MGKPKILLALAERCEAATGPDRTLDGKIAEALGWSRPEKDGICGPTFVRRREYEWIDTEGRARGFAPPPYTGSLDAALTLTPEGFLLDTLTDVALSGASA